MSRIGQLEQRVAERDARIADLEAKNRWLINSASDVSAALATARVEERERCARIADDEAARQEAEYIAARDKTGDGWTVEVRREWAETYARRIATARHIAAAIRSQDDG